MLDAPLVIRCNDGYVLQGRLFSPQGPARGATVIVCPAVFVRLRYYASFAAYLARRGFRVICYVNRGMGLSLAAETRPWQHQLRHWGERDLPAVVAWAQRSRPEHALCAVGHSMGGQLVALSEAVRQLSAIVTVAATDAFWGHWPYPDRLAILAWYGMIPFLGRALRKFPAERLDLGPDVASPLVRDWARWGRHPDYLYGPFGMRPRMEAYQGRVLAYSFADDPLLGCQRAVQALHANYRQADLSMRHVSPAEVGGRIGHFGFFRRRQADWLWERTVDWLEG